MIGKAITRKFMAIVVLAMILLSAMAPAVMAVDSLPYGDGQIIYDFSAINGGINLEKEANGVLPARAWFQTKKGDQWSAGIVYNSAAVDGGIDLNSDFSSLQARSPASQNSNSQKTLPRQVVISIPFQTQQNYYYCGPASARMVVGGIGYHVTQDDMAALLGTTTNGTNAGDSVANALNQVVAGSAYQFNWVWHTDPGNSRTIQNHITEALAYGNPVMVNTMEGPGDVYLAGHDIGAPLYHYGVVADYFDYGAYVTYTDPAFGLIPGFVQDQRVSIQNLSNAVGGRRYGARLLHLERPIRAGRTGSSGILLCSSGGQNAIHQSQRTDSMLRERFCRNPLPETGPRDSQRRDVYR